MSIENDLNRIATALEGLLAYATGTEAPAKKPGRPKRTETVEPVIETPSPALPDVKPAAQMETVTPAATTAAAQPATQPAVQQTATVTSIVDVPTLQKAVSVKVGAGKRDGVLAIISAAGGTKASDVPEAKRAEVLNAINSL